MPFWTLIGLQEGSATTRWPQPGGATGHEGAWGMPELHPELCREGCEECVAACPTGAITMTGGETSNPDGSWLTLDYGRCIACQLCVEACPTGALTASGQWAFGSLRREDLQWSRTLAEPPARELQSRIQRQFGSSFHIRHVDAGSCNGCESEIQALNNPFFNLHRLGIFFTPSPRFADLLLVTGTVTEAMRGPLLATYEAMPEPRRVMAVGACAISGGVLARPGRPDGGVPGLLPVDVFVPGCPPPPAAILQGLLVLLGRMPQQVAGGRFAG